MWSTPLLAQRFQVHYGNASTSDQGLHGVKQLSTGGYVAVGESFTGGPDAVVIRTDITGAQVWANTYQIGTASHATDVVEDVPTGNLIVCGYATDPCGNSTDDIFIMRLKGATGTILNLQVYDGSRGDDQAWKIIETQFGGGGTNPGDFVVAGFEASPSNPLSRNGILLRVDATLTQIWMHSYGNAQNNYFYGVDEVTAAPGIGDLVAAGGSNARSGSTTDIFVVRASGINGSIGLPPQNMSWTDLGGSNGNDEARSVRSLGNNAQFPGYTVVAGFTDGVPGINSEEACVVMLKADPCLFGSAVYFGDGGPRSDRAMDLVEYPPNGNVMVTGYTSAPNFGGRDVFLQDINTGAMTLGAGAVYGGSADDEGWSVGYAGNSILPETPGFIVNGITKSIVPDPGQIYLIKTDATLDSKCNWTAWNAPNGQVSGQTTCGQMADLAIGRQCGPSCGVTPQPTTWGTGICYGPQAHDRGGNGNDGVSGVDAPAVITFTEGNVSSYPNPVPSGTPLNIRFDLHANASADVSVADIVGRVIAQQSIEASSGSTLHVMNTDGWPAGAYLVRVTIGGRSSTTRIVVTGR
ncbi:MAG TPA: T9SS type A sorting domain-containing protein [Candidatus Kapabacteria bacterium]|nr:T9SS type A sorting domain-containing protein [Candidatus Kapabacteria bacterium]